MANKLHLNTSISMNKVVLSVWTSMN